MMTQQQWEDVHVDKDGNLPNRVEDRIVQHISDVGGVVASDASVAGLIGNPASAVRGALGTALGPVYAPMRRARPGNGIVYLGDSITAGSDDIANNARGAAWPVYASILSGQKMHYIRNAGVPGNMSGQMLTRFDTDVTPYKPSTVIILAGTNDIGNTVAFATYQANMRAIVAKVRAIGAQPVLCTIPPNNDSTRKQRITLWNAWLRRYSEQEGITILGFYSVLVDPANGSYLSAYNGDGTHPTEPGALAMAQHAVDNLGPLLPYTQPPIATDNNDPNNLLANGLAIVDTNADGIADSWYAYATPASGFTRSLVTDSLVSGKMVRSAAVATATTALTAHDVSTGFSVGDNLLITGVITSTGITCSVSLNFNGGSVNNCKPVMNLAQPITRGRFYIEATVPPGTTSLTLLLQVNAGTGTVDVGQATIYNLTTMGIVTA